MQGKQRPATSPKRTVYRLNEEGVQKLLATLSQFGVKKRGYGEAIFWAKKCYEAHKGNEVRPVTSEEAVKLIRRGMS